MPASEPGRGCLLQRSSDERVHILSQERAEAKGARWYSRPSGPDTPECTAAEPPSSYPFASWSRAGLLLTTTVFAHLSPKRLPSEEKTMQASTKPKNGMKRLSWRVIAAP